MLHLHAIDIGSPCELFNTLSDSAILWLTSASAGFSCSTSIQAEEVSFNCDRAKLERFSVDL